MRVYILRSSSRTIFHCHRCPTYTYRCSYGACVSRSARCDGRTDCVDASDEVACDRNPDDLCPDKNFQCSTIHRECVALAQVCNGGYSIIFGFNGKPITVSQRDRQISAAFDLDFDSHFVVESISTGSRVPGWLVKLKTCTSRGKRSRELSVT